MSEHCKKLLDTLVSTNSQKKIYNTLLQVHSDVVKVQNDLNYFKENGGISFLVQFLSKPNEKMLNISLGILAECCIDFEGCKKVLEDGILKSLTLILRVVNQDRIHYRCCKLLGNIAHHSNFCSLLLSSNVVETMLLPIMSAEPSVSTQFVALRCLRYLLIGANAKEKITMIGSTVFFNITKFIETTNKDVQKLVLQIFLCLVKSRSDGFLKQIINEDFLTSVISKTSEFSSLILRIIYYLSEMRYLHFVLSKAGVVESIFSHFRKLDFKENETSHEADLDLVLRSLNRLCNEPRCRQKLCCIPDAFDLLLHVVENSSFVKFKKYSVLILCSFMYDENSLKFLVHRHVIIAIIGYLQIVNSSQSIHHWSEDVKNEATALCGSPSSGGFSPMSDSETTYAFCPSPISEPFAPSPTSSVDSVYSPVCSPVNDDIDEDEIDESEKLSVDGSSSVAESPLILQEDDSVGFSTDERIFNLLKQLTFRKEPINDLCVSRTWETLLDYLVLVRRTPNHLTSLLCAIAGNKYYFFELLKSHFALTVNKKLCRPSHVDCNYCQEMNRYGEEILARYEEVAESLYGQQILRNEIIKTSTSGSKVILALTIPHIVKNVVRLEEYLVRYQALQVIIDSLKEEETSDQNLLQDQVACLHSLANDVYLENPRIPCTLCKKCDVGSLTKEATISFLLDDGSTVTANKHTICEKSEFFEAMFRYGFKEANESVVRLSNISSDCLRVLFRLLYSYCDCIVPRNIIILLELIVQSDRFLVPSLSERLLDITLNYMLDYKNCHLIYDWAIENGRFLPSSQEVPICQNVLKFVLVEKLTFNERLYSLRMLLKSRYKANVLSDIAQIIECQLRCKDIQMKSSVKYIKETAAKRYKIS